MFWTGDCKILSCFPDYIGLRGIFAVSCAALTLPVFAVVAFTSVPPLVSTTWLGITYSFAAGGTLNRTRKGAPVEQDDRDPADSTALLDDGRRNKGSAN
ncbi:hypothetical protein Anapl_03945 [Anas platyrhynchos]|uniref:Uncharacterized protein n=1 Tax=Anas platyrhynchos TaxID=8839 RepID=R0M8B9_ANAPL|nr:hypothetical protein Anapl_03945 [Anas platyrhynchos]